MNRKYFPQIGILLLVLIFRIFILFQTTPELFPEEALLGYRAQQLMQHGSDELGRAWPLIFGSVTGYSGPVSTYLVTGSVRMFGLEAWAIRLPFTLIGLLGIVAVGLLVRKSIPEQPMPAWWTGLVLGLSPVHTALSVSPSEWFLYLNLGLILVAAWLYLNRRGRMVLIGAVLGVVVWWLVISGKAGLNVKRLVADQVNFSEDTAIISSINQMRGEGSFFRPEAWWSKLFYNKSYVGVRLVMNFFKHVKPEFLFADGGRNSIYAATNFGLLLTVLLVPFIWGLKELGKIKKRTRWVGGGVFLLGLLPSVLSYPSPNVEKMLVSLIPVAIVTAWGWQALGKRWKAGLVLLAIFNYGFFTYDWVVKEPGRVRQLRCEGVRQVADYLSQQLDKYEQIMVSDGGCPHAGIELGYYLAKRGVPLSAAANPGLVYKIDFSQLNNLLVTNQDNWEIKFDPPTLLVFDQNSQPHVFDNYEVPIKSRAGQAECFKLIDQIGDQDGEAIYEVYVTNNPECVPVLKETE